MFQLPNTKEIVAIRLSSSNDSTEHIVEVKVKYSVLSILGPQTGLIHNYEQESIETVIANLENKEEYYYTTSSNSKAKIEVCERDSQKYIRTKANQTTQDNLLSLPKF